MLLHAVAHVLELTLAILMDFCREDWGDLVDWSLPKRGMRREETKVVEILSSSEVWARTCAPPTLAKCGSELSAQSFRGAKTKAEEAVRSRTRTRQNPLPWNT